MPLPKPDPIAAFAYLRRLPGMDKAAIHQTLKELVAFTEERRLELAGVFFEERIGDRLRVWCELIAACRTEGVVNVLVPNSEHFHGKADLAAFMRDELATTISGTVWLVGGASTEAAARHES